MDERDQLTWVVVELSHAGEQKIESGDLKASVRIVLEGATPEHPMFIPSVSYTKGGRTITVHLMEGYLFVASGLPEVSYFRLERLPYVNAVMSRMGDNGIRVLATIKNSDVDDMRFQLRNMVASDIEVGMYVNILEGVYGNLEGEVLSVFEEHACVGIKLRSLHLVATVPRISLEATERLSEKEQAESRFDIPDIPVRIRQIPLADEYIDHFLGGLSSDGAVLLSKLFAAAQEFREACKEVQDQIEKSPTARLLAEKTDQIHLINNKGKIVFSSGSEVINHGEVVRT